MKVLTLCFFACLVFLTIQQSTKTTTTGSASSKTTPVGGLTGENPLKFNSQDPQQSGGNTKPSAPVIPTTNPNPQVPIGPAPPTVPVVPVPPTTFVCPNDTITYIDIKEVVKKKIYVPYYVYYSPHQYVTGPAAVYLTSLIARVKELRTRLYSFRYLLKHLLQKKKITIAIYQKTDKAVMNKLLRIENGIKQRRLTIKFVNEQLEVIYKILRKLDYNVNIPVDCKVIFKSGKKCKQGYVERLSKSTPTSRKFKKNKVFSKVYITKRSSKISHVVKHKNTIHFIKKGQIIVKKVKKLNPNLRKLIMEKAYAKIIQDKAVKSKLRKEILKIRRTKSPKVQKALKDKQKRKIIVRKILRKKFSKKLSKECKKMLKTKYVKNLRKTQFKDTVKVTKTEPKVEKDIIRLPQGIIKNASTKTLKKFVALKYKLGNNK